MQWKIYVFSGELFSIYVLSFTSEVITYEANNADTRKDPRKAEGNQPI